MMKLTTRGPAVSQAIKQREPFTTHGALRGHFWPAGPGTFGQLPDEHADILRKDIAQFGGGHVYVVWSYDTPIYWSTPDGTHYRPEVRYSVTTSKHQGKCPRNEECAGRGGSYDDRCGRYYGHYGQCDWTD